MRKFPRQGGFPFALRGPMFYRKTKHLLSPSAAPPTESDKPRSPNTVHSSSRPIGAWSENDPTMKPSVHNPPVRPGYLSPFPDDSETRQNPRTRINQRKLRENCDTATLLSATLSYSQLLSATLSYSQLLSATLAPWLFLYGSVHRRFLN